MFRTGILSVSVLAGAALASADEQGYVLPPAGFQIDMLYIPSDGSGPERGTDTVIASGPDFVIRKYQSYSSVFSVTPDSTSYYAAFSPLWFTDCDDPMPDDGVRADILSHWPLKTGQSGIVGPDDARWTYNVREETSIRVGETDFDVWSVFMDIEDSEDETSSETLTILKSPNSLASVEYGSGDKEVVTLIRSPEKPYKMSRTDKDGLNHCAALLTEQAAQTGPENSQGD